MPLKKEKNAPGATLSPSLNAVTTDPHHIHLMGICGVGMASLAGMLKLEGYHLTGSDQDIYPPMSDLLEGLSIPVMRGYRPKNLDPVPDLVIVGNVITRHNPEAIELSRLKIPYLSLPQALRHFAMRGKKSIVVCGTHGKTTTTALLAHVLEQAGMDPSFMVGGIPKNFTGNFKLGHGPHFVMEGDEYDTAFFDKGPKFLHYNPWVAILTSIEFDHADIYRDLSHVRESFRSLLRLIPAQGLLIANGDDPVVREELKEARCPVTTYGLGEEVDWRAVDISCQESLTRFTILRRGKEYTTLNTPLYGRHNISNLLATLALAHFLDIDRKPFSKAMQGFKGIRRRQEIKGDGGGILVLDDFAHHPTAVRETIRSVREKYGGRRLIAAFEPRSNSSRRKVFQEQYALSFDSADLIFIPEPPMMEKVPPDERFSSRILVQELHKRGLKAFYCQSTDALLDQVVRIAQRGDLILFMSNGPFDNLPQRLVDRLQSEESS